MVLFGKATRGENIGAQLASIAHHTSDLRITIVLGLLSGFCALVLAVTLYGITRDEDNELAMLGFACRAGEGLVGFVPVTTLGLLWLATSIGAGTADAVSANVLAEYLMKVGTWETTSAALLFGVGSTIFSSLLLRGRMIPVALAWLGVLGSALIVIILPLELTGAATGPITQLQWIPIALFEIVVAFWLIIKGVAPPAVRRAA
jgi:hypothetical protein